MNEQMLADIAVFLLVFIINVLMIVFVLDGVSLLWKFIILIPLDLLVWIVADYQGFFD